MQADGTIPPSAPVVPPVVAAHPPIEPWSPALVKRRATPEEAAEETRHATLLRQYLDIHAEPCPSCGYDLRRLTGRHCPECGQALRLRVGLETPNMGAFILGLIGLAGAGGFAGLLLLYIAVMVITTGSLSGPQPRDVALLAIEFLASGALLGVWIRSSGRLRRLSAHARWLLAGGCCAWAVGCLVLFTALVR